MNRKFSRVRTGRLSHMFPRVPRSRLSTNEVSVPEKAFRIFVSYERNVTFHVIFITRRDLAVNLSKFFLANRDNLFPREQALKVNGLRTNGTSVVFASLKLSIFKKIV